MTSIPRISILASTMLLSLGLSVSGQAQQAPDMTFFVTSVGPARAATSAASPAPTPIANAGGHSWRGGKTCAPTSAPTRALLRAGQRPRSHRERPVEELQGRRVATSVDDLHGANNKITRERRSREGHHGERRRHAAEPA